MRSRYRPWFRDARIMLPLGRYVEWSEMHRDGTITYQTHSIEALSIRRWMRRDIERGNYKRGLTFD